MDYVFYLVTIIALYASVAWSLDLCAGYTGLLSLAHAAFFGIGAYGAAIVTVHSGLPFPLALGAAIVGGAITGAGVAYVGAALRSDYFALASLGVQVIAFHVFNNWRAMTGGPFGIVGIPHPSIGRVTVGSSMGFAVLALALLGAVALAIQRVTRSPFGRVLSGIREDEVLTRMLGKNTRSFRVRVLAFSAAIASIAGAIYASYITFIDPTSFTLAESILVLSMVILGGSGSLLGPVVGAAILVLLPEALRVIGITSEAAANLRQIALGSILVIVILTRPRGLLGERAVAT